MEFQTGQHKKLRVQPGKRKRRRKGRLSIEFRRCTAFNTIAINIIKIAKSGMKDKHHTKSDV
jgi:hypothetical protein